MIQDLETCSDCFNDFPVSEGTLVIQNETFREFTCHSCEKLPSVSCGACGEFYKTSHKCSEETWFEIFDMRKVARDLAVETLAPCTVEMTGGNCATIFLGNPDEEGYYPVACGAGSYIFDNLPNQSPAYFAEFWIGRDGQEDKGFYYEGKNTERGVIDAIKSFYAEVIAENAGLKEYEVQVSINSFAYIVVLAKDEEHAEEVADSKSWSEWKLDTDFSSADTFQVREMDGEGGYMTSEERANAKN